MIIYNLSNQTNNKNNTLSKEKLKQRKELLIKMNKKIKKQVIINKKREIKSLQYAKNHYIN